MISTIFPPLFTNILHLLPIGTQKVKASGKKRLHIHLTTVSPNKTDSTMRFFTSRSFHGITTTGELKII